MDIVDTQLNDLICAVSDKCDVEEALHLVEAGIDVNYSTAAGCTPLMFAVVPNEFGDHNGSAAIKGMVKALLNAGADPSLSDRAGMTASSYVKQWLDPDWTDQFGKSAFECLLPGDVEIFNEVIDLLERSTEQTNGA